MTFKKSALIILLVFLMISVGFSERITFNNGETLEGYLVSMDQETIRFETMDGNLISINRADVAAVEYQKEVNNAAKTQQTSVPGAIQQSVAPIAPMQEVVYPPVSYPIDVYAGSGLLDPELEARKRLVTFNERKKNPFLASSLGLVFPGCGHFYSEKIASGFFFLGSRALFGTLTWYGFKTRTDAETSLPVYNDVIVGSIGAVGFSALTIFEVIDAYYSAEEFNDILRLKLGIDTVHEEVMPIFGN